MSIPYIFVYLCEKYLDYTMILGHGQHLSLNDTNIISKLEIQSHIWMMHHMESCDIAMQFVKTCDHPV